MTDGPGDGAPRALTKPYNRELNERIRAQAEAAHFGPREGLVATAHEHGRVVWVDLSGPSSRQP